MLIGSATAGAKAIGPSTALPPVDAQVRQVLTQIAEAPGLTGGERAGLVEATATANSIADAGLRAVALSQVSGFGLFLSRTGDSGLPRWTVMTALRAYGLNLQSAPKAQAAVQSGQAAQTVVAQLNTLAQTRGTTVPQALQQVAAQAAAPVVSTVQAKNAAVVNYGGLTAGASFGGASNGSNAADLTTQILSKLI